MTILKWTGLIALIALGGGATFLYAAFGAFLPWREDAEVDRLARLLAVAPGQQIAEIGAGGGRFTVALGERIGANGRIFATELNPAQRAAIGARAADAGLAHVTVVEGDRNGTNLPDACCDTLVMRAVYHHIQDPQAFVASVARTVRHGGSVAVIDFEPGALWFHGGAPDGVRRPGHGVSRAEAIAEFQRAGFTVREEIPDWSGPLWLVVFKR
jgi:SAM-dependent methyltransferase